VGRPARAQALEPVGDVLEGEVVDTHRRDSGAAGHLDVRRGALPVDVGYGTGRYPPAEDVWRPPRYRPPLCRLTLSVNTSH